MLAQLHQLRLNQLSQLNQQFNPVLQTLFGTVTFKNVFAHQIFHSMMEQNVLHAIYLNTGIMIRNNAFIVKETNISTQFQDLANHAQQINHCSETTHVKLVHKIHLMMQDQTLVNLMLLIQQLLQKYQFTQQPQHHLMIHQLIPVPHQKFLFIQQPQINEEIEKLKLISQYNLFKIN